MRKDDILNLLSEKNADLTGQILRNRGFEYLRLDKQRKYRKIRCPDYFFYRDKDDYAFLSEVKTIHSAGYHNGKHISQTIATYEPDKSTSLQPDTTFCSPLQKPVDKIYAVLEDAVEQRDGLLSLEQSYQDCPFVVALFLDPFADELDILPRDLPKFAEVSAIVQKFQDCELGARPPEEMDELVERLDKAMKEGDKEFQIPTGQWDYEHWHYIVNASASNRFDPERLGICPHDQLFKG